MKILLVEPRYKRKYPPLGLMKIATWQKQKGNEVRYHRGISWLGLDSDYYPDNIFITSLFTWNLPDVVQTTLNFKKKYPNADIKIGGVGASAMPDYIEEKTGIRPHIGVLPEADKYSPDYSIISEKLDESLVITQRGCPHKCKYCIVRTIEPEFYEIKGWEIAIDPSKPQITIFDNNILRTAKKHIDHVFSVLQQTGKPFDINSGFDVFLFKKEHAELIANSKINPIRFAFDKMSQEKAFIRSIKLCKDAGIKPSKIRVYVLFNYKDAIREARYRADKVIELGCKPFVMNYKPLDWIEKSTYVSPYWLKEDITNFSYYYNMPTVWSVMTFDEFLKERNAGNFEKEREKKKEHINPNKQIF